MTDFIIESRYTPAAGTRPPSTREAFPPITAREAPSREARPTAREISVPSGPASPVLPSMEHEDDGPLFFGGGSDHAMSNSSPS